MGYTRHTELCLPYPPLPMAQRIQVLLNPTVHDLVKELSEDMGLTLSKTVAQLVEEALEERGIYDIRQKRAVAEKKGMGDMIREAVAHSDKRSQLVSRKTETIDDSDLELLTKFKKFKALEEAGLL